MDGFTLVFGEGTDAGTIDYVLGHLKGYVLEVNGTDVELLDIERNDQGYPALVVAPFDEETGTSNKKRAYHVEVYDELTKLVVY